MRLLIRFGQFCIFQMKHTVIKWQTSSYLLTHNLDHIILRDSAVNKTLSMAFLVMLLDQEKKRIWIAENISCYV